MACSAAYDVIQTKLRTGECVILDGAVATELQAHGARDFHLSDSDHWGFEALQHMPDVVQEVHGEYLDAGCDVLTTDTYGILDVPGTFAARPRAVGNTPSWIELARRSVSVARAAIADRGRMERCTVAFSIGGDIVTEDQLQTVRLLLRGLRESPPDLFLFETLSMMRDDHTRAAITLCMEAGYPVWLSFRRCRDGVCGIHGQLWGGPEGDYFGRLAASLQDLGIGALLINCLPTYRVDGTLPWLREFTDLPLGVYPNLGRYVDPEWRFDLNTTPDDYAALASRWRGEGAAILGGCCGVRPAHIRALANAVRNANNDSAELAANPVPVAKPPAAAEPWTDPQGRQIFPLPLPKIQCDEGVFVPTQGSYLVWKYLFSHNIGAGQHCLDIGCGVGLLAIQLALNGAETVTAMDIEEAAVGNTLTNAFRNDVADKVSGQVADLYTFEAEQRYDTIVASLYQMPTDPKGQISGHRPIDYWGRNLLDHCITMLPQLLNENGTAYIMQISLLGQQETQRLLQQHGFSTRVVDYSLYQLTPVFLDNLAQVERVEVQSDAFHFQFRDSHVMVMYLIEARRATAESA